MLIFRQAVLGVAGLGITLAASASGDELHALAERAWARDPAMTAAGERVAQAESALEGQAGFFDPRAAAAAGYADQALGLYGLSWNPRDADPDGGMFHAGLEKAFLPGFYAGVGASRQEWAANDPEDSETSRVGARLRIPLLRNRGFGPWRARISRTEAELEAARAHRLAVAQRIETEVEIRYADLLLARAQTEVAKAATARADQLVRESEERVRLREAADYQAHAARLEAARRREEESFEQRGADAARLRLEELTGAGFGGPESAGAGPLESLAGGGSPLPEPPLSPLDRRGDLLERLWACAAQEARLAEARDGLRHDLSLEGGVGWEGGDGFEAAQGANADSSQFGGDVSLVWRHALGDRAARAEVRTQSARLRELLALTLEAERTALTEAEVARKDYEAAVERLRWIESAADSARAALAAEEERFRLGEGTSRNVLDAQKDLTDVLKRRNEILADTLRARARYRAACGATGEPFRKETRLTA
jgi:outer membrane protein TolC